MSTREAVVAATEGLHARPAATFVQAAKKCGVPVQISMGDKGPVPARVDRLFPARAGMIPCYHLISLGRYPVPRTRGDDPCSTDMWARSAHCSPHARG